MQFKGTRWQAVNDEARKAYVANAYRVLLTRGRQSMVVFVPEGSEEDATRTPAVYQAIFAFLKDCGLEDCRASIWIENPWFGLQQVRYGYRLESYLTLHEVSLPNVLKFTK